MSARKYIFSLFAALCLSVVMKAENRGDSIRILRREHLKASEKHRYAPSHFTLQYAGGMGFISAGIGWEYGKRCQWETELFAGFVPKSYMDDFHMTFTVKQNYTPWYIFCSQRIGVEPFYLGLYLNSITGEKFWPRCPQRYPKGYYWFSTKFHFNIFAGGRLLLCTSVRKPDAWCKNMAVFWEVHACDMYIISAATNKCLKPADLISLSFGFRIGI